MEEMNGKCATSILENNEQRKIIEMARGQIKEEMAKYGPKPEPEIKIIGADEIISMQLADDDPVIEGLLGEKESLVLVGQGGIGKSIITLDTALHIGRPKGDFPDLLWGRFPIAKARTSLFIQSENSLKATAKRLHLMIRADPSFNEALSRIKMPLLRDDIRVTGSLSEKKFKNILLRLIDQARAEVLILDPLISYHDGDENDNGSMRRVLDCLTGICDQTGIAVVVVHHTGKATADNGVFAGRGASAIGDWAANIVYFMPGQNMNRGGESTLSIIQCWHQKARNYTTTPLFLLERTLDLRMQTIEIPAVGKRESLVQIVVDALGEMGGFADTQDVLIDAVRIKASCKRSTAQNYIALAVKSMVINAVPGKGKALTYKLSGYRPPPDGQHGQQ